MKLRQSIYSLDNIHGDPRYEGFSGKTFCPGTYPPDRKSHDWKVIRLAKTWRPLEVKGRVRKFNDFPGVDLMPAFSARAVKVLRDFLEPNGELLPLASPLGSYFAYNCTTVADVLDWRRSRVEWLIKPFTAFEVQRFVFCARKLRGLTIFRIPEEPGQLYVNGTFAARAWENGLRGMAFFKVWPAPAAINCGRHTRVLTGNKWQADGVSVGQTLKSNTLVIRLKLADSASKGNATEKKVVNALMDELDALLVDVDSEAPPVGNLEGHDFGEPGECRLFLSCPDADALVKELRPWLKKLNWPLDFEVVKRYGVYTDPSAREVRVRI